MLMHFASQLLESPEDVIHLVDLSLYISWKAMEGLSFSDFHRLSELRVCAKFNGSFSSTKVDGAYFIDRDGQLFRYVLEPGMGSVQWIAVTVGP